MYESVLIFSEKRIKKGFAIMISATGKQIESDKILIKNVFGKEMWYCIPDYQRPYVWNDDQIFALLDDISYSAANAPDSQYFLGSIVLHTKTITKDGITYTENDLLDGQQRLATLYLMMAVIRDLTDKKIRKNTCSESIFQVGNPDDNIPERLRIVFDIRKEVQSFINTYIKPENGTLKTEDLRKEAENSNDVSVRNLANAVLKMHTWFNDTNNTDIDTFFPFLRNYVLIVYVASRELEDAFRLFTVLNDRGVKLRNSDILKAENLKEVTSEEERKEYAKMWEDLEGELGEDFDQFLSYVRTILVKEKARLSLLREFEDNIYHPKRFNKETKKWYSKPPLLTKGKSTFEFIKKYKQHYDKIFGGNNYDLYNNWAFDNLITILNDTALSDIWVSPLLAYREAFGDYRVLDFLIKLDNKFSGDWIARQTPTFRIEAMNTILKRLQELSKQPSNREEHVEALFNLDVFNFDADDFFKQLENNTVYGRRYARYILYKLDYLYGSKAEKKSSAKHITVEHILPQNPKEDSRWATDFTQAQREEWTHKLGNLVLISRKKNASQGRLDYQDKKKKYFAKNIETFPTSIRVLQNNNEWTPHNLRSNHQKIIEDLRKHYSL